MESARGVASECRRGGPRCHENPNGNDRPRRGNGCVRNSRVGVVGQKAAAIRSPASPPGAPSDLPCARRFPRRPPIPEIRLTLRVPTVPKGVGIAAGFVALNLLLFVPLHLLVAEENDFWPFFPPGHPRGAYDWGWSGLGRSTYEYAMQLFVRRHNKDIFRVSADWIFLFSSLVLASRIAGGPRRVAVPLAAAAYLSLLAFLAYSGFVQDLLERPGTLLDDLLMVRERVDLRARCLERGGPAARRRGARRVRGLRRAGGAPSRRRVALGRRPRPAAGGRRMGRRQRLLRPVARVVRRAAGRPDHPAPGQAPLLQLAALAGRPCHRGGDGRLRRGGGGAPGGDGAATPSRHLSLHRGILRRGALGRRRLPRGAAGVDAPRGARAGPTAASAAHALRRLSGVRRRVVDEHGVGVERHADREPLPLLGVEAHGRPLSAPHLLPAAAGVLHAGRAAGGHLGGRPLRLRRRDHPGRLRVRRLLLRIRPRAGPMGAGVRLHQTLGREAAPPAAALLGRVHPLRVGTAAPDHGRRGGAGRGAALLPGDPGRTTWSWR